MGCCASAPPKHGASREGVYEKPAEPAVATRDGTEKPRSIPTGEEANPGQKLDWEQHAVADLTPEMREAELAALQEAQLRAMAEKGKANGIGSNSSLGAGAAGTTSGGETGTGHSAPVSLSRGTSSNSVCSSIHVLPELGAIPEDMEVTRKDSFESARSFVTTTSHLSAVAEVHAALHSTPADLPRVSPRSAPYSHSRFGLSGHSPRQAKGGKVLASGDDSYLPPDLPEDFEPFWMPMVGGLTDDPKVHTPAGMAPDRPSITIVRQSISSGSSIKMYEEGSKGQQPWEVKEGLTQQETIAFCLSAPVNGLRCIKTVTKEDVKLRFTREVEMGSFSTGEHQFVFPTSPLPHGPLFRGTYSMRTTFADEAGEELFAVVCEFTLLPNPDVAGQGHRHGSHSDSGVAPSPHAAPGNAQTVPAGNGTANGRGPGPEPAQ